MGNIWIKEFTGGLDTRRMPVATAGGVLIKAVDGHITRGGEFEKRPAFVREYVLPSGTKGLAAGKSGIFVFGHGTTPVGMPSGVTYQRIQHSNGVSALTRVLSYDLYAGNIYVVGEFADGSIFHFYNGTRVDDWFDGRARAQLRILGGGTTAATAAAGSFEVTGGTAGGGNEVTDIKIDGVSIISAPVAFNTSNSVTASDVAAAINSYTSSPNYAATAVGQTVNVTASATGTAANGKTIVVTPGGTVTTGNVVNMAGGAAAATSTLSDLKVNGVSIISAPIAYTTDNATTAAAIASNINSTSSSPDYTATSVGDAVNILADVTGTAPNGRLVALTVINGLITDAAPTLSLQGGATTSGGFTPGTFVKTIGSRMHSVSGANEHFSGIQQPTKWTTDVVGAGFIDMSTQASGSEVLTALAKYQQYVAVFSERVIQIWYFDADPDLNSQKQILNNTGTASPKSVTQFGDNDLFYADESGLRSLRARDSSNAAATTDIGVPVDSLIVEKLSQLTTLEREQIVGLISPADGRFWLCMLDTVFVFSFFGGAKISAWTQYLPAEELAGVMTPFDIEEAVVFRRKVYTRSGNNIYVFGSLETVVEYDITEAEAWLPYLNGDSPTKKKTFMGADAALTGNWECRVAMDSNDEDLDEVVANFNRTTYNLDDTPGEGESTHFSLRFKSSGTGPAKLGAAVIHYEAEESDN